MNERVDRMECGTTSPLGVEVSLLYAECARLSLIDEDHKTQVINLARRVLPSISGIRGYTTLTAHRYLGYLLDYKGIRPNPDRLSGVINFPVPKKVKNV